MASVACHESPCVLLPLVRHLEGMPVKAVRDAMHGQALGCKSRLTPHLLLLPVHVGTRPLRCRMPLGLRLAGDSNGMLCSHRHRGRARSGLGTHLCTKRTGWLVHATLLPGPG